MIKRLVCWALRIHSPSRACMGLPSGYSLRGAIAGEFDRYWQPPKRSDGAP